MTNTQPSKEVLGTVLSFVPDKYRTKILKSKKGLPETDLLFQYHDLSNNEVCQAFEDKDFKLLMQNTNLDRQGLFKCVVERGLIKYVKVLLTDKKVDPSVGNNQVIIWAAGDGHLDIVRLLLKDKRVDSSANDNNAIQGAAFGGHLDIVRLLLKVGPTDRFPNRKQVDPSARNNLAFLGRSFGVI